jgi:hypothetical protein
MLTRYHLTRPYAVSGSVLCSSVEAFTEMRQSEQCVPKIGTISELLIICSAVMVELLASCLQKQGTILTIRSNIMPNTTCSKNLFLSFESKMC